MKNVIIRAFVFLSFVIAVLACGDDQKMLKPAKSIGSATMKQDGTIILYLRAESKNNSGDSGEAIFEYAPNSPDYDEIKKHIGNIKPGEERLVAPWPKEKSGSETNKSAIKVGSE